MTDTVNLSNKQALFRSVTERAVIGHLGILTPDGYPRVVPVNFVAVGIKIYFHGATQGEKYDAFKAHQKITFSIDVPYAPIPSHWHSEQQACRANQYFKSVLIKGRGIIVDDLTEKALAVQALMEKYQPEGGFKTVSADDPIYRKPLEEVAIYRVDQDQIDFREEVGQRLSSDQKISLIARLKERGHQIDLETAAEIETTLINPKQEPEAE